MCDERSIYKRDILLRDVDSYSKDLSVEVINNAKNLIRQLKLAYLPDELFMVDANEFLRINWYEDILDVFMVDVYFDRILVRLWLYLKSDDSCEINEYVCSFTFDNVNLNDVIILDN